MRNLNRIHNCVRINYFRSENSKWSFRSLSLLTRLQDTRQLQNHSIHPLGKPYGMPIRHRILSYFRTLAMEGAAALIIRRAVKETFFRAAGTAKAMTFVASGVIRIMLLGW